MTADQITPQQLLIEVEDVIRTVPAVNAIAEMRGPEALAWVGRASAVIAKWDPNLFPGFGVAINQLYGRDLREAQLGYRKILTMLHQCQNDLRMRTTGPLNVAVAAGQSFEYYDEVRQKIELATSDVFFVDPYLDAEFVAAYLPHIKEGVQIRLLGRERIATLKPSVEKYCEQTSATILVRFAQGFHDRYVFVDGTSGYHSGASFKDGAKKAPTTITQITDAFGPVLGTYETLWVGATVVI